MNKQTNLILIIVVFILLILTGSVLFNSLFLSAGNTSKVTENNQDKGFNYNNYCEYDSKTDSCLPEDKCEFQTDSEGHKVCLGKY